MNWKNADKKTWAGRVISVLICLPFIMSAWMKANPNEEVLQGMAHLGLPDSLLMGLAILEISCVIIYLIPKTAVLGAILLTGYMGGAICSHLRVGDAFYMQILFGIVIWFGIYLRDPRLRQILPIR